MIGCVDNSDADEFDKKIEAVQLELENKVALIWDSGYIQGFADCVNRNLTTLTNLQTKYPQVFANIE